MKNVENETRPRKSQLMDPICPDGPLILGYSVDYYPYVYELYNGDFNGVFVDIFRRIAKNYGCDGVKLRKFPSQRISSEYEVFDGAIDRQEVFTAADSSWLRVTDVERYRYSVTAMRTKMLFMERQKNDEFITDLSFYVVFPTDIVIMILAAWLIYSAIDQLRSRISKNSRNGNNILLEYLALAHRLLNQYFVVVVFLTYQSYFNGNNLVATTVSSTTFSSMIRDFWSGAKKLVLRTGDKYLIKDGADVILGPHSSVIWGGEYIDDCFPILCDEPGRVGLFYEPDLYNFYSTKELTSRCRLAEIALPRGQSTGVPWLTHSIQDGDEYNFLISRNYSRKVMDEINFALLTVYSEDNVQSIVLGHNVAFKYILAAARFKEKQSDRELVPFHPLSFGQMEIPLILLAIGLTISSGAFILEQAYTRLVRKKGSKRVTNTLQIV